MYMYLYLCILDILCIYIYIYIYTITPLMRTPLIINPPRGGTNIVTINLDGGTITPLIRNPPRRQILLLSIWTEALSI